ncbi:MAG: response regulator transcription factor [Saprospiraceae bacterium]|nr:response regulator transcription factor [Saprospiraceae bacterium]
MINLFITDDHAIVVHGIKQALRVHSDIRIVGGAGTAARTMELLAEHSIDVLLLDVQLPDQDGVALCKILVRAYPKLKIIGLTTFSQVSFITAMLRNGAVGYLFKNTTEEELVKAIRTVYAGEQYLSSEVQQRLIAKATRQKKSDKSFIPKLTRREKEVLDLIMEEYTNQEIAKTLFITVSTVETHRMNLCTKLNARNTAGLVKNAIKFGLV